MTESNIEGSKLVFIRGPFISRYISNESSKDSGFFFLCCLSGLIKTKHNQEVEFY